MKRWVDVAEVAARVKRAAAGRPRVLVGIDGPGAAGKSVLAAQLAAAMGGAYVVPVDDFALPSRRRQECRGALGSWFDLPRLTREVVLPGATGVALRYQRYDWARDAMADWVAVPEGAPVIVEGVFSQAGERRELYTFRVWCTADRALRLRRGLARDGDGAKELWTEQWMPEEEAYAAAEQPYRFADLVVCSGNERERFWYEDASSLR